MIKIPAMKAPPAPWDDIPWEQWEDWHWQLANRLTTVEQICEVIHLTSTSEAIVYACMSHIMIGRLARLRAPS